MIKEMKIYNSTVVPEKGKQNWKILEIELDSPISEIKKHIKDEFDLRNLKFILFLKNEKLKKWFKMDENKKISDYPYEGDIRLDIKNSVSLDKIEELKKLVKNRIDEFPYGVLQVETTTAETTKKKLVQAAKHFINEAITDPKNASFSIPSRSGDNIGFDEESEMVLLGMQRTERQFRSLSSVKSVKQLTYLMKHMYEQLDRNIHVTKRDLFYNDVNAFETQNTSDNLIEDVGAMLQVTRPSLNVTASAKGIVVGHIQYTERGDLIDGTRTGSGKSIAPNIDDIENIQSDAEFVLVIEKDAVFNRLAEDQFYDYVPSILVTAKGQPDMATRLFLKKIDEELNLPILALMDADIYGFEILRVYSVGSKALSFEAANLAVPNIKWLGLLPSDLKDESDFKIPKSTHIKMSNSDEKRTKLLLEEEFVKRKPEWTREIQVLLDLKVKAEIQALNAIDPQYITNHYLPMKLESGDFI
ncbi:MAG: hypothetical protein INQ03_09525 [Candidatus Heimdallarchaeota archaeon]|nr:hypothetical protein [Candidatus Heimdallarchaeota archaeon]